MESIFDKVKEFVVRERWEYDFELCPTTSLQDELQIYGDDASEILIKFCDEFNVDLNGFRFEDYFRPEPDWTDFFRKKKAYKKLVLGDLVEAVNSGKLGRALD